MPVKKFKDPDSVSTLPSKKRTPGGSSGSVGILKTSESEARPEAESSLPTKQKHYPNGNKGWANLTKRHENMRERLKGNWNTLSGTIMDWLLVEDEEGKRYRLEQMLAESKLKDIGVMLGISTEKVLLLEGQPTQIIGHTEQKKLDELLPALLSEVKRRGAKVELTERKAEVTLDKT